MTIYMNSFRTDSSTEFVEINMPVHGIGTELPRTHLCGEIGLVSILLFAHIAFHTAAYTVMIANYKPSLA